ncbi:MAG TPA: response regulator transcription factor [Chloroflexia bacterium]|nr:response regulator transcription factor [Chloroflexia bacterium]
MDRRNGKDHPANQAQLEAGNQRSAVSLADNRDWNTNRLLEISLVTKSRLLAEGLVSLLQAQLEVHLLSTFTGNPTPALPPLNPPGHIVLIDYNLGLGEIRQWVHFWRSQQNLPLLVLIELPNNPQLIASLIEEGASGYALLGATSFEVAEVIRQAQARLPLCAPEVIAELFARLQQSKHPDTPRAEPDIPLTSREIEVLKYLTENYSNQEIAANLCISIYTVKHHVHNILEKLRLNHRQEAANLALEWGYIHDKI